jgi:hypothetical protein
VRDWRYRFSATLLLAKGPIQGRLPGPDETIVPVREDDLPSVVLMCHSALGYAERSEEIFAARLRQGCRGFLMYKGRHPAGMLWLARGYGDIYPLRMRVNVDKSLGYLFDEATAPAYRRQGVLGALMRFVWNDEQLQAGACCVGTGNSSSLEANGRLGFLRTHTITLSRQAVIFRRHVVKSEPDNRTEVFWSLCSARENPLRLECDLRMDGFTGFRITRSTGPPPV